VKVFRNGSVVHTRPLFVSTVSSTFIVTDDLPGFAAGDGVGLWMRVTASAGATNEIPDADVAAADMGSTGHLYFEVTTRGRRRPCWLPRKPALGAGRPADPLEQRSEHGCRYPRFP